MIPKTLHEKLQQIDYKGIPTIDVIAQVEAIIELEMSGKQNEEPQYETGYDVDRGETGHFSQGNQTDWNRIKTEGGIRHFQD